MENNLHSSARSLLYKSRQLQLNLTEKGHHQNKGPQCVRLLLGDRPFVNGLNGVNREPSKTQHFYRQQSNAQASASQC